MEVGIRELKNGLSKYLRVVREGGEVVVTDHGKPVARLMPFEGRSTIELMIADGRITEAENPRVPIAEMPAPVRIPEVGPTELAREIKAGRGA